MASPFNSRENNPMSPVPASRSVEDESDGVGSIPRRPMRVKVLYTFDDENKSNCLARLPNALSIPSVSLDETTQIGVIELKTCIQAIVSASPELVAKLGHDYTVYAYDYSEYETPLVGQGMLSWILASASATPNAPADESQTMVTGRVCKNILGLFSNGVKETLEVKLKLIPVPTCMQKEYVENMERYHSLSKLVPDGFDYSAWAEFLKANPSIAQLTHDPQPSEQSSHNMQLHGPISNMAHAQQTIAQPIPRPLPQVDPSTSYGAFGSYGTRPSSPAMSTISFSHYQPFQDSRPDSRASIRSEAVTQNQSFSSGTPTANDQMEEGPPKKRARVSKASRPKKAPLTMNNESLRVTASTAASVRLHRPSGSTPIAEIVSSEQVPRAPTPRPGNRNLSQPHVPLRMPAPSLLRHTSMDEDRPYPYPYDSAPFSDNGVDSADDERGNSPGDTPMDIPSSPPLMPQRMASSSPSSPGLPALPYPVDSGFVSDLPQGRDEDETEYGRRVWDGSDLPTAPEPKTRKGRSNWKLPWTEVNPGPVELLPKTTFPQAGGQSRPRYPIEKMEKLVEEQRGPIRTESSTLSNDRVESAIQPSQDQHQPSPKNVIATTESTASSHMQTEQRMNPTAASPPVQPLQPNQMQNMPNSNQPQQVGPRPWSPNGVATTVPMDGIAPPSHPPNRATTPNLPPARPRSSKPRGLPRSQTWSGEPMSDAPVSEAGSRPPRSGAGAKRKANIEAKLQECLATGKTPDFCNHCGEIETPTWRKAFMRIERGTPADIVLSENDSSIAGFEVLDPTEQDPTPKYRLYKVALRKAERESGTFTELTLCNPCGLWLNKKGSMRPRAVFEKQPDPNKPKRKRRAKATRPKDELQSDAAPYSEATIYDGQREASYTTDGATDAYSQDPFRSRASSFQVDSKPAMPQMNDPTAVAALQRAIQSSPAGMQGNRNSPIEVEPDLTPKPTRRLLFPSPRRAGEMKSLSDDRSITSSPSKPSTKQNAEFEVQLPELSFEEIDKENCPPSADYDGDDLRHLFEEHVSPKSTPTKSGVLQDLLKTPTPGSRKRSALTPKRVAENNGEHTVATPSRAILSPSRHTRGATMAPETPFTKQLNALMSECLTSPSQAIDFSAFPPFSMTPGRSISNTQFSDFTLADDFLSSDLPVPSSPPPGLGFSLYEDPQTCTVGLWSGASIFDGSDAITADDHTQQQRGDGSENQTGGSKLKSIVMPVDFAAMIDGVVSQSTEDNNDKEKPTSPMANKATDAAQSVNPVLVPQPRSANLAAQTA